MRPPAFPVDKIHETIGIFAFMKLSIHRLSDKCLYLENQTLYGMWLVFEKEQNYSTANRLMRTQK